VFWGQPSVFGGQPCVCVWGGGRIVDPIPRGQLDRDAWQEGW